MSSPQIADGRIRPDDDERRRIKEQHALLLAGTAKRLEGEYGDLFTRDTLMHFVEDSYDELAGRARVLIHIPAFVERFARERLRAVAKNRYPARDHAPEVLFVCERNDAVSQMATALFNDQAGRRAHASSAGARPAGELLEEAVHVLHEQGIELLGEFPKPITAEVEQAADVIVTLDAHDDITILDGKQYQAWHLPDRHEDGLDGYRMLWEDLSDRVADLLSSIAPAPAGPDGSTADDLAEIETHVALLGSRVYALAESLAAAIPAPDAAAVERIIEGDEAIDVASREIAARAIEIAVAHRPVGRDLAALLLAGQSAVQLERIADNLVDSAASLHSFESEIVQPVTSRLADLAGLVVSLTEKAIEAFVHHDLDVANEIAELDQQLDAHHELAFTSILSAHAAGLDEATLRRLDRILRLLGSAGGHAVQMSDQVVFLVTGQYESPEE